MAILCCCGKLRSRKRAHDEEDVDLPVPPPPAKLPAPAVHPSALSPGSTLARSSLTNPLPGAATDASVHLGELVLEESSDDDDIDEEPAHDSRNRSTSTLQAVKSRICRHLSQDSLQRQSETEEQIAHRAEVKRLMRKRIQEELHSETDNVPSRASTPQRYGPGPTTLPGNGPRDTIEFTVDKSHKSKELTPISAARVADDNKAERHPTSRLSPRRPSVRSFENENRRPTSLTASEPDWIDAESRASHIECHVGIRERSSLPDMPNSPVLLPIPASSLHDASSLASWRLSLSADKLADLFTPDRRLTLFRPLAITPATRSAADLRDDVSLSRPRSKSSPLAVCDSNTRLRTHSRRASLDSTVKSRIPASKSLIRDESPVGLWLRAQSMPFRVSTTSRPQSETGSEDNTCLHTASLHGEPEVSPAGTPTKPSRLPKAGPYQHSNLHGPPSESRNSADSTRQSLESAMRLVHSVRDSAQVVECQSHPMHAVCSVMPPGSRLASPEPDLQTPSVAPPATDDAHVHPDGTSNPYIHRKGISGLRIPSFRWPGLVVKSQDTSEANRPMTPPSGGSRFLNLNSRRATFEAGSETSSFLRREAELRDVEERFRNSHLRRGSFNPVESKFREVFDQDGDPNSTNRMSLLSKLHFSMPKRGKIAIIETLDGNSSRHALAGTGTRASRTSAVQDKDPVQPSLDSGHLQVPHVVHGRSKAYFDDASHVLASSHANARRLRGFSSSRDGDDTAELWKKAVRAESESRSPRGSMSSNVPAICLSRAVSEHEEMPQAPRPSGAGSLSSSRSDLHSPLCKAHPQNGGEAALRDSLRRSTTILEDWARQLEVQERDAQKAGEEHALASYARYQTTKMSPASWAKFPSFNRDERNAAAGLDDRVKSRDFAVKNISASGSIVWATDRMEHGPPCQKNIVRTFSDKFSQTFKSRLSKLIPGRSRTPSRDRSIRGERRSSIQVAGDLEYPELEILSTAGGYRELRALEAEIHEMKGMTNTTARSNHETSAASQPKPGLAEQMATVMMQHDGCSEPDLSPASDTASFVEEKASFVQIRSPETPALQIRYPDTTQAKESTGSTGERYATPLSHFSSSGNEASSSGTPEMFLKLLPSAHSSRSVQSAKSFIRRASLRATSVIETSAFTTHTWQLQDDPRRRSVPMLAARASG